VSAQGRTVAAGIVGAGGLLIGAGARSARSARRRHAAIPGPAPAVDLTVLPSASDPLGTTPVEVVAVGDSGMAGVGVEDAEETLPVLLARRVAEGLRRPVHVTGHGRPGARTADVLVEQVPRIEGPVDACVVMVGTNDVIHPSSWPRLSRDTAALLDGLGELGAPVVLSSLPDFRAMTAIPRLLRPPVLAGAAAARIVQWRAVRDRGDVVLVDVRRAVGNRFVREPALMCPDTFHPSARGYAVIADVLAPALVEALKIRLDRRRP